MRETPDSRGNDATRRGGKNDRLVGGDLRGVKSVPRGAGDEEAHVIQRPPGAGLRLGPLRALGRRRLGLRRLRSALAAAQLSAHGLKMPGEAGREYPSACLLAPLARAGTLRRVDAVTSPRADTALELPECRF